MESLVLIFALLSNKERRVLTKLLLLQHSRFVRYCFAETFSPERMLPTCSVTLNAKVHDMEAL